jgi:putative membrane-bound dehydrogenase-like protein
MRCLTVTLLSCLACSVLFSAEHKGDILEVPKEFQFGIFASEPTIDSPCSVATTPTGEIFICQDPLNVRCHESNTARLVKLVDSDGDGKADKITVFADKVNAARGLLWVNGTLYAMQQPFLTAYRDTDNDGVSDTKDVLIEGIGPTPEKVPPDHAISGLTMAIDGWLYIACGDQGVPNAKAKDGSTLQNLGGGIVRVRPDGTEMELFVKGLRNIYDVCIDPYLNAFTRDNTNDGGGWNVRLSHVVQTANFGYPSLYKSYGDEIIQPLADYGGGSGTGGMWIHEPALPDGYNNNLFTSDWGRSRIYRILLEPSGGTYKPTQEDFLKGGRPVDMTCDAMGHIYVADWTVSRNAYGANKGPSGRIIRIVPNENKATPFPDLAKASDADLIGFLGAPSQTLRLNAQQVLLGRGKKAENIAALEKMVESGAPLFARVAAMFTLKQMAGKDAQAALLKYAQKDELRALAFRALTDRKKELDGLTIEPFVAGLKDSNPAVRLAACISLSRLGKPEAAAALVPVTADSEGNVSHTAFMALRTLQAYDACLAALGKSPDETAGAFRALRGMHVPAAVSAMIARAGTEKDEALKTELIRTLARLHFTEGEWDGSWFGTRPDTRGPYFRNGTWDQSPVIAQFLSNTLKNGNEAEKLAVLESMARFQILSPELQTGLTVAAEGGGKMQSEARKIVVQMKDLNDEALPILEKLALDSNESKDLRSDAVMAFERVKGDKKVAALSALMPKLSDDRDLSISAHAVLLKAEDNAAAKAEIEKAWKDDKRLPILLEAIGRAKAGNMAGKVRSHFTSADSAVRVAAINAAGALEDGGAIVPLLDLVEKDIERAAAAKALVRITPRKIDFGKLPEIAEKAINAAKAIPAGSDSAVIKNVFDFMKGACNETRLTDDDRKRLQSLQPKAPSAKGAGGKRIADMKPEEVLSKVLSVPGKPEIGKEMFVKLTCVNCHALSTDEKPKGPYLGDIGVRNQRAQMAQSVLQPNSVIAQGFETHLITLNSGERVEGFMVGDSADSLELRNVQGESKTIAKSDIKARKETKNSVMPEGLLDALSVEDFANLLSYLESLKGAKK